MPRRPASFIAIALAALAVAAPARAADPPEQRLIHVSGRGEVRVLPDRASVSLGVLARAPSVAAARAEANRVVAALIAVAHRLEVADADLRTTGLDVRPEYDDGDGKRPRRLVTYRVAREVIVELRNIDRLGELIEQGLSAGANTVSEPVLDSSRRADLEREALVRAVADARATALVLARAFEGSLGPARSITVDSYAGGGVATPRLAAMSVMQAPETYQTGELPIVAHVSANFDFVPAPAAH